jgi:hypothetical protein
VGFNVNSYVDICAPPGRRVKLKTSTFSFDIPGLIIGGCHDAYGIPGVKRKISRPHGIDIKPLAKKLPWHSLFALIVSDLDNTQ